MDVGVGVERQDCLTTPHTRRRGDKDEKGERREGGEGEKDEEGSERETSDIMVFPKTHKTHKYTNIYLDNTSYFSCFVFCQRMYKFSVSKVTVK